MALKNYQYDAIMRDYNRKQLYHKHILDEHIRIAYGKLPMLQKLDEKEADVSVESAARMFAGDDSAGAQLEAELSNIQQERQKLLLEGGFPADYLTLSHTCSLCGDTGFINATEKCVCFYKAAVELLYDESNHREQYKQENFDTFSLDYYSDDFIDDETGSSSLALAKNALKKAKAYVENFKQTPGNLLILGSTGIGKTFLSNCIAKELIEDIYSVVHLSATALFERLASHQFHQEDDESLYDAIYSCDLLIIDDLGSEITNNFVISSLFQCIDTRLREKKGTIITTNLDLDGLQERYNERTLSRISLGYTILPMRGADIRVQKRNRLLNK